MTKAAHIDRAPKATSGSRSAHTVAHIALVAQALGNLDIANASPDGEAFGVHSRSETETLLGGWAGSVAADCRGHLAAAPDQDHGQSERHRECGEGVDLVAARLRP